MEYVIGTVAVVLFVLAICVVGHTESRFMKQRFLNLVERSNGTIEDPQRVTFSRRGLKVRVSGKEAREDESTFHYMVFTTDWPYTDFCCQVGRRRASWRARAFVVRPRENEVEIGSGALKSPYVITTNYTLKACSLTPRSCYQCSQCGRVGTERKRESGEGG
jgi:hypothetical protein